MFEVGIANLAFGIKGFISTLGEQETSSRGISGVGLWGLLVSSV